MKNFESGSIKVLNGFAKEHKWKKVKTTDPYMVSFEKGQGRDWNRINVWTSKRSFQYTIGTYLTHPKQGKTQLFRKNLHLEELECFFKNPREHSGKGYKTKGGNNV